MPHVIQRRFDQQALRKMGMYLASGTIGIRVPWTLPLYLCFSSGAFSLPHCWITFSMGQETRMPTRESYILLLLPPQTLYVSLTIQNIQGEDTQRLSVAVYPPEQ